MAMIPPGSRYLEILRQQEEFESPAVSFTRGKPMALARGKGATLEGADGNIYIDCFSWTGASRQGMPIPRS